MAPDGRSLVIRLRPNVKFHDGSPVTSAVVAQVVLAQLPSALGPAFQDIAGVRALSDTDVEITQKRASPFPAEALDFQIAKPGSPNVGTGPYAFSAGQGTIEMKANNEYYLGRPVIQRIVMQSYPTVRAAWAELLRGRMDMLYEVGSDALDSLEASSQVGVYTFPRPYAYVVVLNTHRPVLTSSEIRQALGQAIDRPRLIREGLSNHGAIADGPVWPQHWAYNHAFPTFQYDPVGASKALSGHPHFTCIFVEGPPYERLALALQKQLAAVGVDMQIEAVALKEIAERVTQRGDFDAVLFDAQLGPNLFRAYQWWHSGALRNYGGFQSPRVDAALDEIRYATNDKEYASGVLEFQRAMIADPPAIFLAWGERARAVSRRFDVAAEPGRDVLATLRLWKPATDQRAANRN
jgi:peptide/nickel transport system substrate-binding protein